MVSWREFEERRPDLADAGRALLYQFGVGLAFLATVRRDGGPRVHPICPQIYEGGLFGFLIPSLKRSDLGRDSRYALHSYPTPTNEDVFYLTGEARRVTDEALVGEVRGQFISERKLSEPPPASDEEELFEFLIQSCLLTRTTGHLDYEPRHTIWRVSSA
jgi:hypothetical protein